MKAGIRSSVIIDCICQLMLANNNNRQPLAARDIIQRDRAHCLKPMVQYPTLHITFFFFAFFLHITYCIAGYKTLVTFEHCQRDLVIPTQPVS